MSQHFLLSAAARSLRIGKVMRMSARGAENVFARLRWPTTTASRCVRTAAARPATIVVEEPIRVGDARRAAAIFR